jgi:hypothetical protein
VSLHRRTTHPDFIEGCFGCKIATIAFGTVPGAHKDARTGISKVNQREKDLHRYRAARQAGVQPDGTTKAKLDESERKQDLWDRRQNDVIDYNHPDAVAKVKRSLTNS